LVAEIAAHVADARGRGMRPAVRLNATSDILWERFPVFVAPDVADYVRARHGVRIRAGQHAHIFSVFPRVSFYDYTKIPCAIAPAGFPVITAHVFIRPAQRGARCRMRSRPL